LDWETTAAGGSTREPIEVGRRLPLTARERLVLTELALGRRTEEMAETIYLSRHTIRSHIKRAMLKLGARTRTQAVAIALAEGSIELERETADSSP
jgi:DNA-binding CsgD family transcriptional regulator